MGLFLNLQAFVAHITDLRPFSKAYVRALRERILLLEAALKQATNPPSSRTSIPDTDIPNLHHEGPDDVAHSVATRLHIDESGRTRIFGATSPFAGFEDLPKSPTSNIRALHAPFIAATPSLDFRLPDFFLPYPLAPDQHILISVTALRFGLNYCSLVEADLFLRDAVLPHSPSTSNWSPALHLAVLSMGHRVRCVFALRKMASSDLICEKFRGSQVPNIDEGELSRARAAFADAAKIRLCTHEFESPTLATIRAALVLAGVCEYIAL